MILRRRNLEIDFVVNRHDERLYIQSAYALPTTEKMDQEQASLLQVADGFRKIIVAGDHYSSGYNEDGILTIGLYDFLLGKVDIWNSYFLKINTTLIYVKIVIIFH